MKAWKVLWPNTRKTAYITLPEEMARKSPFLGEEAARCGDRGEQRRPGLPQGSGPGQPGGTVARGGAGGRGRLVRRECGDCFLQ